MKDKKERTFEDDQKTIDAATPGPWLFDCEGNMFEGCLPEDVSELSDDDRGFIIGEVYSDRDRRLIRWARERWPVALARIRELEAENKLLRSKPCPECKGIQCSECEGKGFVMDGFSNYVECGSCNGGGHAPDCRCTTCHDERMGALLGRGGG